MVSTNGTIKGFYDYTESDLRNTLPKGTYHLQVREGEVSEWDDGRVKVDFSPVVASGQYKDQFGPRITWSEPQDYDGTTAEGREFHISAEDTRKQIVRDTLAIADGKAVVLSNPTSFNDVMFKELGKQLMGCEFIANTSEKGGYARCGKIYPMSAPPKTFKGGEVASRFNVEDV